MTAYCLAEGRLQPPDPGAAPRAGAALYHLTADGRLTRPTAAPELNPGEGLLACAGDLYVEPVEIQVEFLKAADAAAWLEGLAVRHLDRVRYLEDSLWVLAQIREEEP